MLRRLEGMLNVNVSIIVVESFDDILPWTGFLLHGYFDVSIFWIISFSWKRTQFENCWYFQKDISCCYIEKALSDVNESFTFYEKVFTSSTGFTFSNAVWIKKPKEDLYWAWLYPLFMGKN